MESETTMASFSIYAENGYTIVSLHVGNTTHKLGLPSDMATQREALTIWANWALGLVADGCVPVHVAEALIDVLEQRAEARLPKPIRWLRGLF